jgi:hypothetical protein
MPSSSESYYLFSLPLELLHNLTLREVGRNLGTRTEVDKAKPSEDLPENSGRNCNTCPDANHSSLEEQRAHFRSDWHQYNVKLKMAQKSPVSSAEFDSLVDGI